ncbi:MAG: thrombospondin type 3 repeat-containing protein [Myxococcota bacterium]|nr:thrombospondin type 3 repeat-containing protein [Myxococcota bacterium]
MSCKRMIVAWLVPTLFLLFVGLPLCAWADNIDVELRPLAGEISPDVALWEVCFRSDRELSRLTVGVIAPTGYSGTMAWLDCGTAATPGSCATPFGTTTVFDDAYQTVDGSDSFSDLVGDTLFLVLGGQGQPSIDGFLSPVNWLGSLKCVARLSLTPGVDSEDPPGLVSLLDPDTASIDYLGNGSDCIEPIVVDGARDDCAGGSGSGLGSLTATSLVVSSIPEDYDGDLHADEQDNCVFTSNVDQADSGGLKMSVTDGVGDACQCGEGDGNGTIGIGGDKDLENMLSHLQGTTPADFNESRCSVGSPATCTIYDAALLDLSLKSSATLDNVCSAFSP